MNELSETKSLNQLLTPLAIIISGALVAGSVFYSSLNTKKSDSTDTEKNQQATVVNFAKLQGENPSVLGSSNAPVTVIEFADFQCPFCGRFFQSAFPSLKSGYIDNGKIKFIFRNFAFLGQESIDAGMAAYCAQDQGKFWEYHDFLLAHQKGENQGAFTLDNLKKFAKDLGLDTSVFAPCLDSKKYKDRVAADTSAGRDAGVTGTPTVFVNDKMIVGAQAVSAYTDAINAALSK